MPDRFPPKGVRVPATAAADIRQARRDGRFVGKVVIDDVGGEDVYVDCEDEDDEVLVILTWR